MGRALWVAFTAIFTSLLLYLAFVGNREQVVRVTSAVPNMLNGLTTLVERISLPGKRKIAKTGEGSQPEKSSASPPITLENIEYELDGQLVLVGKAAPGGRFDFFIDGVKVEPQSLKANGNWRLVVPKQVSAGQHQLEVSIPARGARPRTIVVMTFVKAGADEIAAVAASRKIAEAQQTPVIALPRSKKAQVEKRIEKPGHQATTGLSKLAELAQSQSIRRDVIPLGELLPGVLIGDGPLLATPQSETVNPALNRQDSQPELVNPRPEIAELAQKVIAKPPLPEVEAAKNPAISGYRKVTVRPGKGLVVVQPGNTLWDMAISIYGSSRCYQKLYRANRRIIKDPRRIFPGQVIYAPDADPPTTIEPTSPPQWSPPQ